MPIRAYDFRQIFLIWQLKRLPDGSYIALNRRYNPVGVASFERVEYESAPYRFEFKSPLTSRLAASLSYNGDASVECVQLYGETSIPTRSASAWKAYSARLARLSRYMVVLP